MQKSAQSMKLTIAASIVLSDVKLGDSIAVNGVCLTVAHFAGNWFTADVMPETFHSTSLAQLAAGSPVNLERALAADGRFGGHFVTGHVDGTAVIQEKRHVDNALYITLAADEEYAKYFLHKGSIALDGTSLTIFDVKGAVVTVSLIPHSQEMTVIAEKKIGDAVNVECDLLAKYVENMLGKRSGPKERLSESFLEQHGFI